MVRLTTKDNVASLCTLSLLTTCNGHMIMKWPPSLRSKFNPATPQNLIDYSLSAPLTSNPSNFPCKGYQNNTPLTVTAMYEAGSTYNMTLDGSADHGGGSCQLSLSYDNGKTFKVIKSIIGGCTEIPTYDFTVPSYAPEGHALFAWSWSNYMGNREFYMNCAAVHIMSSTYSKRSTQFDNLPNIWVADLAEVINCTTDGTNGSMDPVYPNPGPEVQYGSGMSSASPVTPGDCQVPAQNRVVTDPSFAFDPTTSIPMSTISMTSLITSTSTSTTTFYSNSSQSVASTSSSATAPFDTSSATFNSSLPIYVNTTSAASSTVVTSTPTSSVIQTLLSTSGSTSDLITSSSDTAIATASSTSTFGLTPDYITSTSNATTASSTLSSIASTTTMTMDCPATVTITLPPTSYVATATYTISPACTGTAAVCPCANDFQCLDIGDCTWECLPIMSTLGPSFMTSTVSVSSSTSAEASSSSPSASSTTMAPATSSATSSAPTSGPGYADVSSLDSYLPCQPGTFICTDASTWYTCSVEVGGTFAYQYPRTVAAGMQCLPDLSAGSTIQQGNTPSGYYRDDQYVAASPYGACSAAGSIQCSNGGQGFQVCSNGVWVDMGSVAAGTQCVNGQITALYS